MKKSRQKTGQSGRRTLSRGKKISFYLVTISIPVLFFVLLEFALRFGNYGGNLDLFYYPERFSGEYAMLNHHYHEKFFFRTATFQAGRGDVFLAKKPENGFRVFVQGASTAESFPYGYNGLFSLVLKDMLQDVLPGRHVEIINLGITATNTYTLYDQIPEILKMEPDAILIYSGQNEYYGALGVGSSEMIGTHPGFVRAYLWLYRYRTFLMLRDLYGWMLNRITGYDKAEADGTLMQRMVQQNTIPFKSRLYDAGKRQYRSNLEEILRIYGKDSVPVFISSLVSNLKDHSPFYSVTDDEYPPADQVFGQATSEYEQGLFDEAFQSFRLARDLDALRFRAPSEFNDIIRETAENFDAFYVPVKEKMTSESENGIIGNDLMLEHLHPNSKGYSLIAKTFFEALIEADLPGFEPDLSRLKSPEEYRKAMHLTELDHQMVWHRVEALKNSWPFVDEPDPDGYPANYHPASELDRLAINYVQEHISWEQAKTGMAQWYSENGMHDEAIAEILGALRVVPYEEEAWRFAGRLAMQTDRPHWAIEFLTEAIRIRPTNSAFRMLGTIYFDLEEFEQAAAHLEEAYSLNKDDLSSLFNASVAYASNDQYAEALRIAEQIAQIHPGYSNIQGWVMHLQQAVLEN